MNIYIALLHHPVYNKKGKIVTTSVTTLDIHDISRISKTYGITKFFLVTPLLSHKILVNRMINHWTKGFGAVYNPTRREAFKLIEVIQDIESVKDKIERECGGAPAVIATCAKGDFPCISFFDLRKKLLSKKKIFLIVFGTGWGLAKSIIEGADYILEPITGVADFNHLSVRAAVAIVIDRLMR